MVESSGPRLDSGLHQDEGLDPTQEKEAMKGLISLDQEESQVPISGTETQVDCNRSA